MTSILIGRPIIDILGPEAFERLLPYFQKVLSGQVVRYEEQVTFRGIGPRWITATYTQCRYRDDQVRLGRPAPS